jgi:hypothetical protein
MDPDGFISLGIPPKAKETSNAIMERASRMKYTTTTNDAYRMATNWIAALDIDLEKMAAAYPLKVQQGMFHSNRGLVPSPVLSVQWGDHPFGAYMTISAVSGELLELLDGNGSFRKRKPLLTDLDKLVAISDEDFLRYSVQEWQELVERFAAVKEEQKSVASFVALYDKFAMTKFPTNAIARERKPSP